MKRLWWAAVISALCLPVSWPLLTMPFFASDDGLFHLYRVAALDDALRHGVIYPRLFPSFAFGYGQAVFNYYGPLSYYVTELIHLLGVSFADALKWTFALGYVAAGCALFFLARQFVSSLPALLGAIVYVYFPYHIAETYQRGALAEHLAFVFLPLALLGLTPISLSRETARPAFLAGVEGLGVGVSARTLIFILSLAALIVTHSLTAMIFLPFIVLYYWVMNRQIATRSSCAARECAQGRRMPAAQDIWSLVTALLFGLGLSAFYWLPVGAESRWVGLSASLDSDGYQKHLAPPLSFVQPSLIFQYAPQQIVSADHPLGLMSFVLLIAAPLMGVRLWRRRDPLARPLAVFIVLTLAALFMTLDLSLTVWQTLRNPLAFLQYPWRFMTLAALGISLSAAILCARHGWLALLAVPLLIVTATFALSPKPLTNVGSDEQAMWQHDFKQRQIGATWTAEYMPWWVRADRTAIPAASRAPLSEVSLPAPELSLAAAGYAPTAMEANYTRRRYRLFAPLPANGACAPITLRFHQFYLPQWRVTLGGKVLPTFPSTDLGLLSVDVPCLTPGQDILEVDFALTDVEQLALFISLVSLMVILWHWRGRWLLSAVIVFLLVGLSLFAQRFQPGPAVQFAAGIYLEDVAELVAVRFNHGSYRAGDALQVTLTWLARRETSENFKGFVHLTDASGAHVIAQSDGDPVGGFTPTSQWRAGEIIEDTRVLQIPADTAPGKLRLFAGLYRFPSLKNLTTIDRDGRSFPANRIPTREVEVVTR